MPRTKIFSDFLGCFADDLSVSNQCRFKNVVRQRLPMKSTGRIACGSTGTQPRLTTARTAKPTVHSVKRDANILRHLTRGGTFNEHKIDGSLKGTRECIDG